MVIKDKIKIIDFGDLKDEDNFFELIKKAYCHLKTYFYYDKFPLEYRKKIAQFESNGKIEDELKKISHYLFTYITTDEDPPNNYFKTILENIKYTPFPKKILSPLEISEENGSIQLITNDRKYSEYYLDKFELFIDTKDGELSASSFITIQIISILWIFYIGVILDDTLEISCYGSRIKDEFKKYPNISKYIYNRYFDKYTEWRDKGISIAQNLLDVEKRDSIIISLDVSRYYYSVSLDFENIYDEYIYEISNHYDYLFNFIEKNRQFIKKIHLLLKEIHTNYSEAVNDVLPLILGSKLDINTIVLPIGLISSGILGNWYLKYSDREIIRKYNPDYYGRYVDDILIVIKSTNKIQELINSFSNDNCKIFEILKHRFSLQNIKLEQNVKTHQVFGYSSNDNNQAKTILLNTFSFIEPNIFTNRSQPLKIQIEKTRIYHLDKDSSRAVLSKIKKTIQKNASFFKFLPDDEWEVSLEEVAYDLISKGSTHKLRNIIDISENDYELVKYLTSISIKYKLCELKKDEINNVIGQIFHFFSGVNIVKYFKLWERIFSILFLFKRNDEVIHFYELCNTDILKINMKSEILETLKVDVEKIIESITINDIIISSSSDKFHCEKEEFKTIIFKSILYQIPNSIEEIGNLKFIDKNDFIDKTLNQILKQAHLKYKYSKDTEELLKKILSDYFDLNEKRRQILKKVISSLLESLYLSISHPMGLLSPDRTILESYFDNELKRWNINGSKFCNKDILIQNAKNIRFANLTRDQYVVYPLINLLDSEKISLIDYKKIYSYNYHRFGEQIKLNLNIINYPSKIYHLWEYLLLLHYIKFNNERETYESLFYGLNTDNEKDNKTPELIQIQNGILNHVHWFDPEDSTDANPIIEEYYFSQEKTKDKIKIGIAHLHNDEQNLINSLKNQPNISIERQNSLYNILNNAEKLGCDLLIFPELSIPVYWLPFMIAHAKRHQIGIIFGLEHWCIQGKDKKTYAFNFAVTVLPFKDKDVYNECFVTIRKKNHYAPLEKKQINEHMMEIPDPNTDHYHLFHWRGCSFTVFNCYELADINHKAKFRSKIDFLVAIEYNKDTNYYSNIVESISRDLHCYVVQVNIPQFGDSRIIQPKKSENKNLASISGGNNSTLLIGTIDIKSLREFQLQDKFCGDGEYKPLPPGFSSNDVKNRGKLPDNINKNEYPIWIKRINKKYSLPMGLCMSTKECQIFETFDFIYPNF